MALRPGMTSLLVHPWAGLERRRCCCFLWRCERVSVSSQCMQICVCACVCLLASLILSACDRKLTVGAIYQRTAKHGTSHMSLSAPGWEIFGLCLSCVAALTDSAMRVCVCACVCLSVFFIYLFIYLFLYTYDMMLITAHGICLPAMGTHSL